MLSRLDDAIHRKIPNAPVRPDIFDEVPSLPYPSRYGGSYDSSSIDTLDESIKWLTKNRTQILKEFKAYVKEKKEHAQEVKRLEDLKTRLRDELMLGNDLQDLISVLKKVEQA
jgi:hypothetical protein